MLRNSAAQPCLGQIGLFVLRRLYYRLADEADRWLKVSNRYLRKSALFSMIQQFQHSELTVAKSLDPSGFTIQWPSNVAHALARCL